MLEWPRTKKIKHQNKSIEHLNHMINQLSIINASHSDSLVPGKWIASTFLSQKVLFSCDKKNGLSVVKLNFIQMILRNIFGCYKNTHLDTVFKYICNENFQQIMITTPLYLKIAKLWENKFLKWIGNSSINQANVICFGEEHGDTAYRTIVNQFINKNYKEGDIILVEGVPAGVQPKFHPFIYGVNNNFLIMGWEPANFRQEYLKKIEFHHTKWQEISKIIEQCEIDFPDECNYDQENINFLKIKCEEIQNKIFELNKYYQSDSPKINKLLPVLLQYLFETKIKNPKQIIIAIVTDILSEFDKLKEKILYKYMSPEANEYADKNNSLREISLIQEIQKFRQLEKKVFVIGGMSHFNSISRIRSKVKDELAKHQFVLLERKSLFWRYAWFNREYLTPKTKSDYTIHV